MTDAQAVCISGCRYKPKGEQKEGDPKKAAQGHLCRSCADKLLTRLSEIPIMYALLPEVLMPGGSQRYDGTTKTKQPEAPAPGRLEVIALTEKRRHEPRIALPDVDNPKHLAQLGRRPDSGVREPGDELWYELEDIPKVLAIVHNWAETLRCELDPQRERKDLNDSTMIQSECTYLRRAVDRLAEQSWVDECMTDLNTVWVWLTRVHGFLVGPSVGVCFKVECDGKIYRDRFTGIPKCRVCRKVYNDPDDWIKLKLSDVS